MHCAEILKNVFRIESARGSVTVNLAPMNHEAIPGNDIRGGYTTVQPDGFLFAADLVGIVGLHLNHCPCVPRICWDNREHHFWDGFQGSFETRNVVINAPGWTLSTDAKSVRVSCYYMANFIKTTLEWTFMDPEPFKAQALWDTLITVENLSGRILNNYGQFFACYHKKSTNYYWDSNGTIEACTPESFNATRSVDEAERLKKTPFHDHMLRNLGNHRCQYLQYSKPVLLSEKQPWFNHGRHIIFVDPHACAAVVTWMNQARDYYIRPPEYTLAPGKSFNAHIRHIVTPVDSVKALKVLWAQFEEGV